MAYYCGECVTWINSDDGDRYGRKYCDYSRRYEEKDQNIYGCRGFVYAKRMIITKICEILCVNPDEYFEAFDDTKEFFLIPSCIDKLIDYNTVGSIIINRLECFSEKEVLANNMLNGYIIPAFTYAKAGNFSQAVNIYERMVKVLAILFHATKENIEEEKFFDNLIKNPVKKLAF